MQYWINKYQFILIHKVGQGVTVINVQNMRKTPKINRAHFFPKSSSKKDENQGAGKRPRQWKKRKKIRKKSEKKSEKNRASAYICFCRLRAKSRI